MDMLSNGWWIACGVRADSSPGSFEVVFVVES